MIYSDETIDHCQENLPFAKSVGLPGRVSERLRSMKRDVKTRDSNSSFAVGQVLKAVESEQFEEAV